MEQKVQLSRVIVGVSQCPQFTSGDRFGHGEGVAPHHVDVLVSQRGEPCDIRIVHDQALGPQLLECGIHVDRIPKDDHIHHQPQGAELVFLSFPIPLIQLAALAVKQDAAKAVAILGSEVQWNGYGQFP